jgi:tetratricopeptide (TPR) repeat protein
MIRFIMKTMLVVALVAVGLSVSQPVFAQSSESKQQLIERFRANSRNDHKAAYEAAKEFFQKYPDDNSDDAQFMRRWVTAYEKVELGGQPSASDRKPANNSGDSGSSADAETPEVAEARIAITKYKDYQGAIKTLESSSPETKRKSLWLYYMAMAQEGVGNEVEELKYLEKYNELVPNQKETVEKLADLRYRVKKKMAADNEKVERDRKELEEESQLGNLEQTKAWLQNNATMNGSMAFVKFEGSKMIWTSDSKKEYGGHSDVLSVLLSDLDLENFPSLEKGQSFDGSTYLSINFSCKKDRGECIYRTWGHGRFSNTWESNHFIYRTQQGPESLWQKAESIRIALRHVIRLSQQ